MNDIFQEVGSKVIKSCLARLPDNVGQDVNPKDTLELPLQGKRSSSSSNIIGISNNYNNYEHIHNTFVSAKCTAFIIMISICTVLCISQTRSAN